MKRQNFVRINYIPNTPQETALTKAELERVHQFRAAYFKNPKEKLTDDEVASLTSIERKVAIYCNQYRHAGGSFESSKERLEFTDLFHDLIHYIEKDFGHTDKRANKFQGKNLNPVRIVLDIPVHVAIMMLVTEFYSSSPDCKYDIWRQVMRVFFSDKRGNYPKRLKPLIYRLLENNMHETLHHLCVTDWLIPEGRVRQMAEIDAKQETRNEDDIPF